MKTHYNFICFIGVDTWENYTRRPHLEPLKRFGKLIIFEAPITINRLFNWKTLKAVFSRQKRVRVLSQDITVIKPLCFVPAMMARKSRRLQKIYFASMKGHIDRHADKTKTRIVMLFHSYQDFYTKQFNEDVTTLDYNDKFDLYPHYSPSRRRYVRENERNIIQNVDIVFATAYRLQKEAGKLNPNAYWVPNCIDHTFTRKNFVPDDIKTIRHPVVGFVGNINSWLDFQLINFLAEKCPSYQFVFIGSRSSDDKQLDHNAAYQETLKRHNIHYLGRKKYTDLYSYIKYFDVSANYYIPDEQKQYTHPNKFYMYLSSGNPVVSTNFLPEAKTFFKDLINFADTYEEFLELLKQAVEERSMVHRVRRIEFARSNNNMDRVQRRHEIIQSFIKQGFTHAVKSH